jgi:TetR/AcrR family transcriptional regulator, transcriptional repressor for nem operon
MSVCVFCFMVTDTKDKILFVALKFFLTKPYTEVTMSEILKESGLSKGGFYHHFESKEVLYCEIVNKYLLGSLRIELDNIIKNSSETAFRDSLPSYLGSMLRLADEKLKELDLKPEDINLYNIMFDMMKYYKGFDDILCKFHDDEINMLKTLIENGIKTGELKKDLDSLSLANHIHALMHGISVLSVLDENIETINERVQELFEGLYRLIKA